VHVRGACGLESWRREALEKWRAYSFNACYQLLCISLLFRNSRKPPRLEPVARSLLSTASVSFLPRFSSFLFAHPPNRYSFSTPDVLVPAASYPTRCFINENEGASYIFLTYQSRPALVLHPSFFPSWISSFWHYCYHFPRRSHSLDGEYPHNSSHFSSRRLCSPSLPPLLAAVILLSVHRTGLSGMRQRARRKINSDWHHACFGNPSQNLQKGKKWTPLTWYQNESNNRANRHELWCWISFLQNDLGKDISR